jgi:hypothetical protein
VGEIAGSLQAVSRLYLQFMLNSFQIKLRIK